MFKNIFRFISVVFLFAVFTTSVFAQTTLISPTGDGGFENGSTFAANGWTDANSANNPWVIGTALAGSPWVGNTAYVSNDGGTTNAYTNTAAALNFFYRDVTVPAGESKIVLTFDWICNGESTWDLWQVFTAPTTVVPVGSTTYPGSGTNLVPTAIAGATFVGYGNLQTTAQTITLALPSSLAGTTFRLIFGWKNDTFGGIDPPAGFDNISLVSSLPVPLVGGNTYPINGTENPPTSFASMTSALAYINTDGITGSGQVVFEFNTGYAGETGPVSIGNIPGASSSLGVTFRPATGYTALTEIIGAATPNQHAISITGSYITLDGRAGGTGTSRDWTIRTTGTNGQMAVRLNNTSNSMTGIALRYLIMEGEAANTTGGIFQITGGSVNTISDVIIEDNLIRSNPGASTFRGFGMTLAIANNVGNTGIIVRNNEISQFYAHGINLTGGFPGAMIYDNHIYHTAPVTQPTTTNFRGIHFSTSSSPGTQIFNNYIYDVQLTNGPTTHISGIEVLTGNTSGDPVKIYNNRIILGPGITATSFAIYGIHQNSTTTTHLIDVDFNSVLIGGTATAGTANSAAFRKAGSTVINVRNNIFYNARSNAGGSGTHWGIMSNNSTFGSISNNDYFADGTGGILGTNTGTTAGNRATLAEWQAVVPTDNGSVSQNPNYLAGLKIDETIATQLESGGTPVAGITTDFEGDVRNATTPDIGADEFNGIPLDLTPPLISYTLIGNQSYLLTSVSLTATITDFSGVATGVNLPRLYVKKINDVSYVFDNAPTVAGDDYTFTVAYSAIGGVAIGDTIVYYVAAQDVPGNAATNPAGGSGSNPPGTTPPPVPNGYIIVDVPLSGTYTVGISSFEMLTGKKLTFETRTRTVTRDMNGVDAYEDFNANVNDKENPSTPDYSPRYETVTETYVEIMENGKPFDMNFFAENPRLAAYPTITAAVNDLKLRGASGPVTFLLVDTLYASETYPIDLTNFAGASASNTVTIKPATGVNATIPGLTGQTTASIWLRSGSYYVIDGSNTVGGTTKNLTIQSFGTAIPTVHFYSSGDNNVVKNCIIKSENTSTGSGSLILAAGTGSSNNLIENNLFRTIDGAARYAIGVYSFSTFTGTNNMISNNVFADFNSRAIQIQGALGVDNNDAMYNTIYQINPSTLTFVYGIFVGRAPNTDIEGNLIYNLSSTGAAPTIAGFYYSGASGVDMTVRLVNNAISVGGLNTAGTIRGIDYWAYVANSFEMYYNTVYIAGSGITGGTTGAVNKRDAATNWVMVDNVFLNERSNGTGTGFHYGAQFTNITASTWNLNYNDYYANGAGGLLGRWGTADVDSLLEWQNATLQDANSLNTDPLLVSESDLRPYVNSPVIAAGTPVAGITTDILGVTRSATAPTMGAYEQGAPLPTVLDPTDVTATAVSDEQINVAFTPNANTNNVVIVYNLTGIFTAPVGAPVIGGSLAGGEVLDVTITSPYSHIGLTQVTTYYYRLFSYDGSAYSPGVTANATTQATPLSVPYSQSFDAATFPPSWSQTFEGGVTSNRWNVNVSSNAGGSPNEMRAMWASGTGISRLIVGPIITTGLTSLSLEFKHFFDDFGIGITGKIQSSSDATTWNDEAFSFASGGGNIGPETVEISIANNVGSVTYIAWVLDGDHFQLDYWYVDDVAVTIPLPNDVGTVSIDIASLINPGSILPQATVRNYGTLTQSFPVQMTITGGYSSTKNVTSLAPGATEQVTFDSWNAVAGIYTVDVCTQLGGDQNTANDCLDKIVSVADTSGQWTSGSVYPTTTYLGSGVGHNGFLYSIGGNTTSGLLTECYKYEVATDTWTAIAPLPAGRRVLASAAVGNFVYAIGGSDAASVYQATLFKYDIALNTWSTAASIPITHGWGKAVSYGDSLIYLAGGWDGTNYPYISTIYVYNVNTNTWATATSMPNGRIGGAFSRTGNKLVYVGGADYTLGIVDEVIVGTIDPVNPLSITWTTMMNPYPGINRELYSEYAGNPDALIAPSEERKSYLPEAANYPAGAMYRFDAAPWGDDGIIVATGSPTSAWVPANPNPCYVYLPETDSWIPQKNVPIPVLGASLGSVSSGTTWKLVVASGYTGSIATTATQVYTYDFGVAATFQLSVNIANGWNMVSIPGLHPVDQNVNTWWAFRDLGANVFRYAGGYQSVTDAVPGIGYWMKHAGARTYNTGDEWPADGINIVPHDPIAGASGWNLFGGYELSVTAANVTTNPPGLQTGPIFAYSGGYQVASTIDPGYGYWIKLTGAGQIIIPETMAKGEVVEYFPEDWGRIILTDAAGINYTLYAVKGEVNLDNYELPPAPPTGMFDIRYTSGRIAENINSSIKAIEMTGVTYPLTVRVEGMDIRLMDESGKMINVNLKSGEDVVISDATIGKLMVSGEMLPTVYSLEQNYPNPFNPSTVIEFSLPEDVANVKLTIYNALGEKVAELVNTSLQAGRYQYQWNARDVATGMYIYELRTDKFVSVKKMLLLK